MYLMKHHVFCLFIGITDEGFEMLDQLAYLYLANNKVSHSSLVSQLTKTLMGTYCFLYFAAHLSTKILTSFFGQC